MKTEKFKFFDHMADIKFQAYGKTINEVFENSALAMSFYLSGEEKIASKKGKIINVQGQDYESLLYNFLDELIYLLDAESFVISKVEVQIMGFNLKAELYGDDAKKYKLDHIKAATYAEMHIKKIKNKSGKDENWEAQVVLDV